MGAAISESQKTLFLSADHSSAIGYWPALIDFLGPEHFGLIWVDAHLDAHNYLTSPSQNLHGMPVQALLGSADQKLEKLYPGKNHLLGNNLLLLGARSFEDEELKFINEKQIAYLTQQQLETASLNNTLSIIKKQLGPCSVIGISIDFDVLDPGEFPAVNTAEPGGMNLNYLTELLSRISKEHNIYAVELSEFNPDNDENNISLNNATQLAAHIVEHCMRN